MNIWLLVILVTLMIKLEFNILNTLTSIYRKNKKRHKKYLLYMELAFILIKNLEEFIIVKIFFYFDFYLI